MDSQVCAVCGRVLDYMEGRGWLHANVLDPSLTDHPAVPVPASELQTIVSKCDFCYADEPGWVIPARSFVSTSIPGAASDENWAACDECVTLISRNDWKGLLRRVRISWESRHGEMDEAVEASLRALYRQLRRHLSGPPRRLP